MLVLTRKVSESILIREDIEIVVLSIQGNRVKLGIKAPATVNIKRSEIDNERLGKTDQVHCD